MISYPFRHRLEVRFRDCDPMGHVNHAVYFTYFEQARFACWAEMFGRPDARPAFIVAHAACDYRAQAFCGDALEVGIRLSAVGRTSFTYEYGIVRPSDGRTVAAGRSVQVVYDYGAGSPVPLTGLMRERLERLR